MLIYDKSERELHHRTELYYLSLCGDTDQDIVKILCGRST